MSAFIIVLAIVLFIGLMSSANTKIETAKFRESNRGSRAVELEEWNKWSRIVFNEYKELTGQDLQFPEIDFGNSLSDCFGYAYAKAFGGYLWDKTWRDSRAIEMLRIRHNLPTDDDIYAIKEYAFGKKIIHRPTNYTCLANIITQCVHRAVHERGYKYGGLDYEGQAQQLIKKNECFARHPHLTNDPTKKSD